MHLKCRGVNDAFNTLVSVFANSRDGTVRFCDHDNDFTEVNIVCRPSRNGAVVVIDEPVLITYSRPTERVLFNGARDANCFFHLYEALWMLAGRNDVAPLTFYNSRMREFSDDGKILNGAYGYRWRKWQSYSPKTEVGGVLTGEDWPDDKWTQKPVDQLDILVDHLKANPESRRAVLQMWQVGNDLLKIGATETTTENNERYRTFDPPSKDVCCNLSVMFALRPCLACGATGTDVKIDMGPKFPNAGRRCESCWGHLRFLDITVTNRSNDLVWGLLGANFVHFSFLQEYMAARLGAEIGVYNHFTNNLHCYVERPDWKPEEWLADNQPDWYTTTSGNSPTMTLPLVKDPVAFERELPLFVEQYSKLGDGYMDEPFREYTEPFLKTVAQPMMDAFHAYKRKSGTVDMHLEDIAADDWRVAASEWVRCRVEKKSHGG